LPRAQPAIHENPAVTSCNERTVPRAPAAEHGQAEHGSQDSRAISACANEIVRRTIVRSYIRLRAGLALEAEAQLPIQRIGSLCLAARDLLLT
jgi:hypothetical protein